MAYLTRDGVLGQSSLREDAVSVPEWGGEVRVRELTVDERRSVLALARDKEGRATDTTEAAVKMVCWCALGEDGRPLFSDNDAAALKAKSARAVERLAEAIGRMSGLAGSAVEDAAKN